MTRKLRVCPWKRAFLKFRKGKEVKTATTSKKKELL